MAVIRPFNTYGPRQSARAVIPTIITQLLAGKKTIKLGSLHPTRDFNYVGDTVAGFIAMAEAMAANRPGIVGEVVNIGSNFEVSIGDTAKTIAEIMGVALDIATDDARIRPDLSEVERLWADNRKAAKLFGWKPKYAGHDGFRRGLSETVTWFSAPGRLGLYKADIYNL